MDPAVNGFAEPCMLAGVRCAGSASASGGDALVNIAAFVRDRSRLFNIETRLRVGVLPTARTAPSHSVLFCVQPPKASEKIQHLDDTEGTSSPGSRRFLARHVARRDELQAPEHGERYPRVARCGPHAHARLTPPPCEPHCMVEFTV